MLSATRLPTMPYALRPKREPWRHERPADHDRGNHNFFDPWIPVCLRCPLLDCILPEGGNLGYRAEKRKAEYAACPIVAAQGRGWDAAAAVERAGELGLLEVGE